MSEEKPAEVVGEAPAEGDAPPQVGGDDDDDDNDDIEDDFWIYE